jgi:L-amino acid N-acyltransferase YncA
MGVGMAPARVGQGLRAVVQQWNARSLRLARALGFAETGTHTCVQGGRDVAYVVLGMSVPGGTESS